MEEVAEEGTEEGTEEEGVCYTEMHRDAQRCTEIKSVAFKVA